MTTNIPIYGSNFHDKWSKIGWEYRKHPVNLKLKVNGAGTGGI
jgi:hypothetical protein